jgi:hypothetical protein
MANSQVPEGFTALTKDGGVVKKVIQEGEEAEYEDDDEVMERDICLIVCDSLPRSRIRQHRLEFVGRSR